MASTLRVGAPCAIAALALLVAAPAAAAPKAITGKLSKAGYSVMALAADGEGKAVRATPRFRLRPPAKRVTLHLRGRDGVYAGPVVVGKAKRGRRALVGVKRGARLGKVRVRARKGYARARPADKWIDPQRMARAKRGVPIGAGRFGLVRSRLPRVSPPGDLDADGIANVFDVDANGNRVLDRYEGTAIASATANGFAVYALVLEVNADGSVRGAVCGSDFESTAEWPKDAPEPIVGKSYALVVEQVEDGIRILSASGPVQDGCPANVSLPTVVPGLLLTLRDTVNANAAGLTASDLDETLARHGFLWIQDGVRDNAIVELDCGGAPDPPDPNGWSGGLSYCTKGGTGRVTRTPNPGGPPRTWPLAFPACCDSDVDGFGELGALTDPNNSAPAGTVFAFLSPGATTDDIGTGDVLNWRITTDGVERQYPRALAGVFATVPALVRYSDGAGNSGAITYPLLPPYVGSPPNFWGGDTSAHEPFEVAPCDAAAPPPCVEGDVVLTFTFWRPQREPIAGEGDDWIDIGGLAYSAIPAPGPYHVCTQEQLFTTDPSLEQAAGAGPFGSGAFRDRAPDRRADPANTLTLSLNLTDCLREPRDQPPQYPGGWGPDIPIAVWLSAGLGNRGPASPGTASAIQQLYFTMK